MSSSPGIDISINRLFPGEKLGSGDKRWKDFNGGFSRERHTIESLVSEIMQGHSFCCALGGCRLDHCGGRWCCQGRQYDPGHCGRPYDYRISTHFSSAQTLELDFDKGDETSSIDFLLADPFIARNATFLYSTLSSTPRAPKTRVVFVLDNPYTDPEAYHDARRALINKYPESDQSIKDVARFLYGSSPATGEVSVVV